MENITRLMSTSSYATASLIIHLKMNILKSITKDDKEKMIVAVMKHAIVSEVYDKLENDVYQHCMSTMNEPDANNNIKVNRLRRFC